MTMNTYESGNALIHLLQMLNNKALNYKYDKIQRLHW